MALITIIGVAYGAYVAYQKQLERAAEEGEMDPAINPSGRRTRVPLSRREQTMAMMELPLATVSFFGGNYKRAAPVLEKRVEQILDQNPWLGGWLVREKGEFLLLYDPDGSERPPGHFQVYDDDHPDGRNVKFSRQTPYVQYGPILDGGQVVVPVNSLLVGKNQPLWKVAVLPNPDAPEESFALVVSMSHVVGDTHTYYKLYNMLDGDAAVPKMNPIRYDSFEETVKAKLGPQHTEYMHKLLQPKKKEEEEKSDEEKKKPCSKAEDNNVEVEIQQEEGKEESITTSSTGKEKMVMKMFYVDEGWIIRRKGRRVSVFDADVRGSGVTVVTANAIIVSWFFKLNQATVGMAFSNLRNCLEDVGCSVGQEDAGNYTHSLICTERDYETPGMLQHTVTALKRGGRGDVDDDDRKLPDFDPKTTTASVALSTANFYRDEIYLHDDVHQELHVPLVRGDLLRALPEQVSAIHVFTAHPVGIDGSERRPGAFVFCRESIWTQIQQSGIVDQVIFE